MEESPRECAITSEPGSGRPNPFNDVAEQTSRKRQRVSRGSLSRSRSVDTAQDQYQDIDSALSDSSMSLHGNSNKAEPECQTDLPSTPPNNLSDPPPAEPTSSRVTINLRTNRTLVSIPSSPVSAASPSKMPYGGGDDTRISVESESDALSTIPPIETPSSTPSAVSSPQIELVDVGDDDSDFGCQDPPLAIIDDEYLDPMQNFPYLGPEDDGVLTAFRRITNFLQYEDITNPECFFKMRDWVDAYLFATQKPDIFQDLYSRHRELWKHFPDIIWSLSHRSKFFGGFLKTSTESRQALTDFFVFFARLAGRFVAMDVRTLFRESNSRNSEPDLASQPFVHALAHLILDEESSGHIGKNLHTYYSWSWGDDSQAMGEAFQEEGGDVFNMTKLTRGKLALMSGNPKMIESFSDHSRIVSKIVSEVERVLNGRSMHTKLDTEEAYQKLRNAYEFFVVMSDGLDCIIEKHLTYLTGDSATMHMNTLRGILRIAIEYDIEQVRAFVNAQRNEHRDMCQKNLPDAISLGWKFGILKRLITSSQMQLRVVGVTTMCNELLGLHSRYKDSDPSRQPILLLFSAFILENQLVDYLVGIGSHPEIISESGNIIGFLVVTKTYTHQQTDMIWQTVSTSQDPRVVEAILAMLKRCLNLYDYSSLLYLCEKAMGIPIDLFNVPMREFCSHLFKELGSKFQDHSRSLDQQPYDLCVRLIRESSVSSAACPLGYPGIQSFASNKFHDLLRFGPTSEARTDIHQSCITDIAARTSTVPGSICVISILLQEHLGSDLKKLTVEHGLTNLLIEELESVVQAERDTGDILASSSAASSARLELIQMIIVNEPEAITPELGTRLWDVLVGSRSNASSQRNISWQVLNNTAKNHPLNAFIKSCFRDHLQTLPPHCYTTGSLDFVREAITAWFNDVYDFFVDRNRTFDSPALDQLWRMILTAPPDTIDALAINILVETYVSSALIMKIPRQMARSVHSTLVNRCLEQLKGAAAKLKTFNGEPSTDSDDSMIIVASEDQFQEQEMIFARSLAVLREFLRAYQTKPQFAPPKTRSSIITAPLQMDGEPLAIKYQAFDGNDQTEVTKLNLGTLNTVASLFARLENATGFKNYRVYCGGAILDPEEMDISQKLQDLQCLKALLLVHRKEDSPGLPGRLSSDKTTLEFEITKHCKDLWGYLGMHEKVAQEIYYFLIKFPVYDRMLEDFASDVTYTEIFPAGKPFKSLYAVHSLRQYIAEFAKGTNRDAALTRAISLIVAAISDPTIVDQCDSDDLKEGLALHMIDCLLQYLKEPVLPISAAPYLDTALFKRLLSFLYAATPVRVSQSSQYLTARSFESMLEASIHNISFWEHFLAHMQGSTLLEDLVLKHPQQFIRKNATKQILTKSAGVPSLGQVSATMFVATFWPMVAHLIPLAVHLPYQCEETFSLGLALFKRFADVAISQLNLEALAQQWGNLLLNHKSLESVGHTDNVDAVAQGLTFMIFYATSFTKASQKTLSCSILGAQLFREHLFPELSIDEEDEELVAKVPLLNPTTRRTLAETVYFLVKDDEVQYRALLLELSRLVPHVDTDDGPYIYDLTWQFDRSKSIRSSAGFVGLKNLSNTCYLNSLFSQLFMNIPFRKFMLDAHVADGGSSQRLLSETQNLFSYMQNSFRRFVDPVNLASSIRTYEETPIDVSIQMDVDEFYNLLFDRWESQILAPDAKREFRSFYGGQLVQQVKSKECPHISERLEPFSAIQCDIKGKSTLEESLQAYVNGEVMEGDNKYKCSTCDRHVDAVKRACLKDIPDNLIFHLKRFDFNLRTLMRSKINDHFQFPKKIDMRPYKVEHLNNEPDTQEDVFELVGVLVHSGTAESGHYYSFIRERPSTGDNESWVEFNDECVSSWDPNRMEGACYGGPDFHGPTDHNNNPYDKSWSAYMLFYQRSTVVIDQKQILDLSGLISPVRLPVPPRLSNYIAMENELLMRKYCLYDPSHAAFVLKMLSNMKNINGGTCSSSHTLEKLALTASLHHLDQVFARTKDTPDFPNIMISIKQICQSCAECSRDYLEWFCDFPETLKQLLIKNPDGLIRHEIATSILAALVKVKADASYAYGFSDEDDSIDDVEAGDPQLIQRVVKGLSRLWDIFHSSFRAWPEYFGLLVSISQMGKLEAAVLLDAGYLQRTMEMISADPVLPLGHQYSRMLTLLSKRLANRPVSFDAVITLLYNLMITCDPSANPAEEGESRLEHALVNDPVPYNDSERNLLMQHWTKNDVNILLEKLLLLRQNPDTTQEILIRLLEFPESLDRHIFQTITIGIKRGNSTMTCSPFLRAAAVYCERSQNPKAWSQMITFVSKMTPKFDNGEGGAVLNFFRDVFEVTLVDQDYSAEDFLNFYFGHLAFWAPHLLTDYEASVRNETEEFIRTNLLQDGLEYSTFGTEEEDLEKAKIYIAAARKLGFACLEHCQEYYLRDRQQAVRAVLVQIQDVTLACEKFFDFGEKDDETRKFYDMSIHTWTDLKKCIVEEPDEEVSDWDGSEGEYDDSSEPVGTVNDDDMPL